MRLINQTPKLSESAHPQSAAVASPFRDIR